MGDPGSSGSRATECQREYARQLGIAFSDEITRAEIGKLIDEAVNRRDENRYQELDELEQRESDAWQIMRTEVLAEIDADPEDCRLSKAETSQIVEELSRRGLAAVLITMPWNDFYIEDWVGVGFTTSFSDDMLLDDAGEVIKSAALTFWKRDGIDLVAALADSSTAMEGARKLLESTRRDEKAAKGR